MLEQEIIKKLFKIVNKPKKNGDFPVGALIIKNGKIISKGCNNRLKSKYTTDHAEIIAIRKANRKLNNWRLNDCELYVTLEPCDMCKSIIKEARIKKVYYYVEKNTDKFQYSKTKFIKQVPEKNSNYIADYLNKIKLFFLDKR